MAEYREKGADNRIRPVRQIVAQSRHHGYQLPNTKVFTLPMTVRSAPADDTICLYLQVNNKAIPIRAAGNGDTARFRYAPWSKLVSGNTQQQYTKANLNQAQINVQAAQQALTNAKRQHKAQLNEFNQQLKDVTLVKHTVATAPQCQDIQVNAVAAKQPYDVVSAKDINKYAERNCVYRIYNGIDMFKKEYFNFVSVLPFSFSEVIDLDIDKSILSTAEKAKYKRLNKIYVEHYPFIKRGSGFKPHYGKNTYVDQSIRVSGFSADSAKSVYAAIKTGIPLTKASQDNAIKRIGVELAAVEQCIVEGKNQLTTKLNAWNIQQAATPKRLKAKKALFVNRCHALFDKHARQLTTLKAHHQNAVEVLSGVKQQVSEQSHLTLPTRNMS